MRRIVALLLVCASPNAFAHDSLEHTATRLDQVLLEQVSVPVLIERADVHRELGEFAEAHSLLEHAAELEPDNPSVYLAQAENHAQFDHHEEVVDAATGYIERGGTSLRGLWLRAAAQAELGDFAASDADCETLAGFDANVEVVLLCARVSGSLGTSARALSRLQAGYEDTGAVVVLLAAYEAALAQGNFELAAELAAEGATLGSLNTLWLLRQAVAVELAGDDALAFALREEALLGAAAAVERRDSCLNRVNWVAALAAVDPQQAAEPLDSIRDRCQADPELRRRMSLLADAIR